MKPYYSDGSCVIYHGDCREILPTLPKVDLVLTDPPYGVGKAQWDGVAPTWWLNKCMDLAPSVMATIGIAEAFSYPRPLWIASYSYPSGFVAAPGGGFNAWTPVFIWGSNRLRIDSKQFPPVASERVEGHPCPKPMAPWKWLVASASTPGSTILDPFMGSGTTLRAAKDLGRKAIGIEIEERYCEIAAKRLAQEVLF
jgi:site-specific DNA-methyltransferase (adenine-specific)